MIQKNEPSDSFLFLQNPKNEPSGSRHKVHQGVKKLNELSGSFFYFIDLFT
jgi:hypothetical protein